MNLPYDAFVGWLLFAAAGGYYLRSRKKMVNIKAIQDEIEAEMREDETKRAKSMLKDKAKQIANAERVLENLKREYHDLIVRIGEGSV